MERWEIHQDGVPALRRFCPGCGCERPFVSSGKFRMNANGRRLDVWLIYKCPACGTTWNMEVVARTPVSELSPGRLRAYESNNRPRHACACDPRLFAHGQAVPVYDEGFRIKNGGRRGKRAARNPLSGNAALRWTRFSAAGSAYRASRSRRQSGTGTSPEREEASALHQGQRDSAAAGPDRSIEPPRTSKAPTVIPWGLSTFVFRASFAGDKVLHAVQSSRPAGEI